MAKRFMCSIGWRWEDFKRLVRVFFARPGTQWARIVMDREMESILKNLKFSTLSCLEVSGEKWKNFGFMEYRNTEYPGYDFCAGPLLRENFDLVIAEQVLEHVPRPQDAVRSASAMLRSGGFFLVNTPFLIRVHDDPKDYYRWTEGGLRQLLIQNGFEDSKIETGAWGNRACVKATLTFWAPWIPWKDSLVNEPQFPVVVWALAKK